MKPMFDDAGTFGKEWMESTSQSLASLSSSAKDIATEVADYTKSSYEAGASAFEKLFAARSLETAMQIQTDYARKTYEGLVAETTKLSGLYTDMAKNAYKPYEQLVARAR